MGKRSASIAIFLVVVLLSQDNAFGDVVGCQCYCGKFLRAPCGDEDCKRACGWQEPPAPSSEPSYDYEAERQRELELERQRQREIEEQRKREAEETRRRQEEFERNKQEALKSMKGISEGELGLKGSDAGSLGLEGMGDNEAGGLGLKGLEEANPNQKKSAAVEPPEQTIRQDIEKAKRRIPELEKDIKGLQTLLRQFGASSRGGAAEFEKWQEAFQAAADNSVKTAKEYGLSLFLQYTLLGSLEASVRKDTFGKLNQLINSSDPKMRRWLGEQMQKRGLELEQVKEAFTAGTLGNDGLALYLNDAKDEGKALDALLFANDLMETFKVVPWEGAQYFQQARVIGETYTDLAIYALACLHVRKTQKATDEYTREISYLSTKLRDNVKEMNCLKECLDAYTPRCLDRCEGKTRFGSPPPSPR